MGTALVTGATSGIGLETAWQLAADRHGLVLVARNAERLEEVAAHLRAAAGVSVEVLPADVGTDDGLDRVIARLEQRTAPVGLLVNNAGFGLGQSFVGGTREREEEALAVMVRAVLVLSQAAARAMVARGHGAILNVSSVASLTAMGTYSAHKAWVRTFTEGLASELRGTGVTATAVCPGFVRTEFHARAGLDGSSLPAVAWIGVHNVVAAALDGVRRGRVVVTPTLRYAAASALLQALPRPLVRALTGPRIHARTLGRLRGEPVSRGR